MPHHEVLYISDLSAETNTNEVAKILVRARTKSQWQGIVGRLLFDGARFVHMLSGPYDAVAELMQCIRADGRHRNLSILHEESVATPRFADFKVGYWYVDNEAQSAAELRRHKGVDAVNAFLARQAEFDL
jgi:Sensors of blue-light using FAD